LGIAIEESQLIDNLRLIRSENVGPKSFMELLKLYGSVAAALQAIPELSSRYGKVIKVACQGEIEKELEQCHKMGAKVITYLHDSYPKLLRSIHDFPPVITIFGREELLTQEKIAMVGARNASSNACRFAYKLANDLGGGGLTTVSGLARGVDTAAHKGSLESGTIAVIAGGIDKIYPPENADLYHNLAEVGLIIAESPFGAVPTGQSFPRRNRIISGMSWGTVVIEAGLASGSLITAKMALAQNREVFAVPGFPMDARCFGSNQLIKDGANITTCASDILEMRKILSNKRVMELCDEEYELVDYNVVLDDNVLRDGRALIYQLLSSSPTSMDELLLTSQLTLPVLSTLILELELAGKIERHPGNKFSLIYKEQ
jgi:DNA processing protein